MANTVAPESVETATFRRLLAESDKFAAEQRKLTSEAIKLDAEAAKFRRDRDIAIWQVVAASVTATAALIGAGAALGAFILRLYLP